MLIDKIFIVVLIINYLNNFTFISGNYFR